MKRHPSLIALSREHHDGLVMAQRLIRGWSRAGPAVWPPERPAQLIRLLEFVETVLWPHFTAEESVLFPSAESVGQQGPLVAQLRAEHAELRRRCQELEADPHTDLAARLTGFGTLLRSHIRREERLLFEGLQQTLSDTQLRELGAGLEQLNPAGPGCALRREPDPVG